MKTGSAKTAGKTIKKKKKNLPRIILAPLALIVALAFILFSVYTPWNKSRQEEKSTSPSPKGITFRKDNTIKIMAGQSEILIDVEVADKEEERMQGLMYRYSLAGNQGMFFIFPEEEYRSFWMKNTYIPLDIIYISSDKKIVSIQKYTQPRSTYSLPSEKPAKYVLEVNAGFADKHNINPGDSIVF